MDAVKVEIARYQNAVDRAEIQLENLQCSFTPDEDFEVKLMDNIARWTDKLGELQEELKKAEAEAVKAPEEDAAAREAWDAARKAWKLPSRPMEQLGSGPAPPL
jgi:chromosome segregation ATPase